MKRLFTLLIPVVLPVAVAAFPTEARAQNAPEQAEARTLFDAGLQLFQSGSYAEACTKLEASYHLFAGIGTRGKLAECYEKVGRTASAWAMYQEVVALAGKANDATRERVARERADALAPNLSHLTVVLDSANDAPGLVVKRGADTVERGAMGSPFPVDPGTTAFAISAPGRITKTVDVSVGPKEQVTFTVPALELEPAPVLLAPPPVLEVAGPAPAESTRAWQRPAGIVLAGAGVVTVAVGAVLALAAKSSYDAAFNAGDCEHATLTCDATGQSETDGARSRANIGGVLIGVGAAVFVGGGVLFLAAPRAHSAPVAVRLIPRLGMRAAGLSLQGDF
jgi:hypothetical protein